MGVKMHASFPRRTKSENHLAPVPRGKECYIKRIGFLVVYLNGLKSGFGDLLGCQPQKVDRGSFAVLEEVSLRGKKSSIHAHIKKGS